MPIFVTVLPEDAIREILLRLPVKSLNRFKCVAKSWYACITDPQFINRHFLISNNQELLLISHLRPVKNHLLSLYQTIENNSKHFRLSYPNSSIRANPRFAKILGPCNGIFCLFDSSNKNGEISLWNPTNRQLKTLPKSQIEPPSDAYPFDTCVGFGFDDESNDFRVVSYKHMCFLSSSTMAHAELYSLRTNTWKEVEVGEEFQPTGNLPHSSSTPSVNGIFSWFEIDNRAQKMIFSFNMKTEVFVKTQLPDYGGIPSKRVHGCLGSLQGKLAFIHDYPLIAGSSKCFDVWVLGEYGFRESWVKQLTIGPLLEVTAPLGFWKNGELLLEDADRKRVVSYDPISQDMEGVGACKMDNILQVLPYKESLVCFKEDEEEGTDQNREMASFSVSECHEKDILDN